MATTSFLILRQNSICFQVHCSCSSVVVVEKKVLRPNFPCLHFYWKMHLEAVKVVVLDESSTTTSLLARSRIVSDYCSRRGASTA